MTELEYAHYLQSSDWQILRVLVFRQQGYECRACKSKKHIQVHHLTYDRIGEELTSDLVVLCDKCHKLVHKLGAGQEAFLMLMDRKKRQEQYELSRLVKKKVARSKHANMKEVRKLKKELAEIKASRAGTNLE